MVDRVRIKKAQQSRIAQWCKILDISESRFIEDAIAFYFKSLEGKTQEYITTVLQIPTVVDEDKSVTDVEYDDPENFDGGIEL